MDNSKVGKFIAERRKELGYNQKDLAEKLNVTDKAVSKWETGRSSPDVSMLIPLAKILGVSVTEILNGEKISEENISSASNEIIVESLKKSNSKRIFALILTLILLISTLAFYPVYEYTNSISANDDYAIKATFRDFLDIENVFQYSYSKFTIKGDYIAYLYQDNEKAHMVFFQRNKLFKSRMNCVGGTSADISEIGLYSMGWYGENINIFFGAEITAEKYGFVYRGVEHTVFIEDDEFIDIFIDKDNSYTNPSDWYFIEE